MTSVITVRELIDILSALVNQNKDILDYKVACSYDSGCGITGVYGVEKVDDNELLLEGF